MDTKQKRRMAMKQTVLITGGAGSLGQCFVNLLKKDYHVISVDSNEWAVASNGGVLGDFVDYDLSGIDYVIHCAAYKHVDLGENNPDAFIENNVIKTMKFFKKLSQLGIRFVFISTDKAVEPINLYGFTKAIGEKLALFYGGSVARLGNIIASSGSVIPLWEKAIENKEPIPITDENMIRFFIEGPDAANQIWHEFLNDERVIIPICTKKRLLDILAEVLKKHGYDKASDYEPGIVEIGIRPGEKLEEKLEWPIGEK
jgi:FlaA1/EpsC-like NDP-sugar epimerase